LRYPYMKDAPTKKSKERIVLTLRQYHKFCTMDLAAIPVNDNAKVYQQIIQ